MSQVRKFYNGGKNKKTPVNIYIKDDPETQIVSGPKSQGSFTIDGKTYSGEDLADDLERTGSMYSPNAENVYRAVAEAVRNGQHVVFDTKNNIISGMDGKWGISERANNRLSKTGRSEFANGLGALFNTQDSKVRDNLRYLGQYTYRPIKDIEPVVNAPAAPAASANGNASGNTDTGNKPKDIVFDPKEHGGYTQEQLESIGGHWDAGRNRVVINDPEHIFKGFSNRNYRFNDLFFKAFTDPKYAWLKDKMIVDGVLYDQADADKVDSEVYKFLRQQGGYYDRASNLNYAGANELMENLWNNKTDWGFLNDHLYSNILSKQNRGYQDMSDLYDLSGYAPDSHLVRFVDVDPTKTDAFGEYKNYSYHILDKNGNDSGEVDITKLAPNAKGIKHGAIEFRELLKSKDSESPYNNRYVTATQYDDNGNRTGTYFYVNPNDPDDLIIHMDEFNKYNVLNGGDIRLPRNIAHIFLNNPNLVQRLNANPTVRDNFAQWLAGMFKNGSGRQLSDPWHFWTNANNFAMSDDEWSRLGFDDQTRQTLISFYKDFVKNGKSDRQDSNLVYAPEFEKWEPQSMKNGGQIQKLATGDILGSVGTAQAKANETKSSKPIRSTADEATTSDILKGNLTEADKLDIAALAADLASFGLSLSQVGSLGAAGVGVGGSLARFASDIKRDGFQWSDAGSLGMNLLFDGVTALPGLGTAGKIGKLTKTIKASAPTLLKFLKGTAALGVGQSAYTLVKKVANGEELSIRDWSTLANGLTAAVALNRSGLRSPVKTKESGNYKSANFGEFKGKKMELSADEMKTLAGKKTAKERMDFAAEKLTEKANAGLAEGAEKATKEQLLEYLSSGKVNGVKTNFKVGHEGWKPTLTQADIEATPVMEQVLRKEYSGNNIFGRIGNLINGRGKTIGGRDRLETNYQFLNNKTKNEMVNNIESEAISKNKTARQKAGEERNYFTEQKAIQENIANSAKEQKTQVEGTIEKLGELIKNKNKVISGINKKGKSAESEINTQKEIFDTLMGEDPRIAQIIIGKRPQASAEEAVGALRQAEKVTTRKHQLGDNRIALNNKKETLTQLENTANAQAASASTKIEEATKRIESLSKDLKKIRNRGKAKLEERFAKNHNTVFRGWTLPAWNNLPNPEKPGNRREQKTTTVASPTWKIGVVQPSFKNGGIIKAQFGTGSLYPSGLDSKLNFDFKKVNIGKPDVSNMKMPGELNLPNYASFEPMLKKSVADEISNAAYNKWVQHYSQIKDPNQQYGRGNTSNQQGGWSEILGTADPSNLIDAGNYAAAMADSRRQYDSLKDYHAAHAIAPTLVTPRLQLNAGDALRSTISSYRKPVSSDSMQNAVAQQMTDQQNTAIKQKANLADAQQYSQYLAGLNSAANQQAQINAQTVNANAEADSKVDYKRRLAYNQMVAQNSQIRNQHLNKLAYDAHNRWMAQNQANTVEKVNNELVNVQQDFNKNTKEYYDAYVKWANNPENIDSTTGTAKLNYKEWLTRTGRIDQYNELVMGLKQRQDRATMYRDLMTNYGTTFGNDFFNSKKSYKSGGKVTKVDAFSALSNFDNQAKMLIESGKVSSKFISDLNKLIQQAKKSK